MKRALFLAILLAACQQHKEPIAVSSSNLSISSPAFANGQPMPKEFGCDGSQTPPIVIKNIPSGARTLSLIVTDPDAPGGLFTHWVVWNIPVTSADINAGQQGKNSYGSIGYGPPCPPAGSHRYIFDAYALDMTLNVSPTAGREQIESAMKGHIVGHSRLVGIYSK